MITGVSRIAGGSKSSASRVFRATDSMTQLHANQAVTKPASGADVQPHVGFRVPMAVLAVCACILLSGGGFAASFSDSNASLQVHRTRHGLQMPGVNAAVNAAQMVEIQTVRYGSKEVLPGFAMSQLASK